MNELCDLKFPNLDELSIEKEKTKQLDLKYKIKLLNKKVE